MPITCVLWLRCLALLFFIDVLIPTYITRFLHRRLLEEGRGGSHSCIVCPYFHLTNYLSTIYPLYLPFIRDNSIMSKHILPSILQRWAGRWTQFRAQLPGPSWPYPFFLCPACRVRGAQKNRSERFQTGAVSNRSLPLWVVLNGIQSSDNNFSIVKY